MSPYGALVRHFRNLRSATQEKAARAVGVTLRVLSAVETGRRRPFSLHEEARLAQFLGLTDVERQQLREAARLSSPVIRIPRDVSPLQWKLAHEFVAAVQHLGTEELALIKEALSRRKTAMT